MDERERTREHTRLLRMLGFVVTLRRRSQRLTQRELARLAGLAVGSVLRLEAGPDPEQGPVGGPALRLLFRVAEALGTDGVPVTAAGLLAQAQLLRGVLGDRVDTITLDQAAELHLLEKT